MESSINMFTSSGVANTMDNVTVSVSTLIKPETTCSMNNHIKSDIKVTEDGIAKLTFSFLDDMQGDSSLEPGEVKTPPPGSSPATTKDTTPLHLAKVEPPEKLLARENLAKALKTVSQLEAEACEEKVRQILELDAKRRKEEKIEREKSRSINEGEEKEKEKQKTREERKKIKELKRAQKAAKKAMKEIEEEEGSLAKLCKNSNNTHATVKIKVGSRSKSPESEGLCSSPEEDSQNYGEKVPSTVSVVSSTPAPPRFPNHIVHSANLSPDAFMVYRGINPFMRGPRVDFARGTFNPRGRGMLRGRMAFPGFRPPFFGGPTTVGGNPSIGGLMTRHHLGHHRHHQTPPPNRGHSPILPPSAHLQWTKFKPTISYAFKMERGQGNYTSHISHIELRHNPVLVPKFQSEAESRSSDKNNYDELAANSKESIEKIKTIKETKKSILFKESKKSKKLKKANKHENKTTSADMFSKSSRRKKNKDSSRRKIEKIRKTYGTRKSSEDTETSNATQEEVSDKEEYIPNEEEIRNKVQNIKVEKVDMVTELKIEDITLKVKPLLMIKKEPTDKDTENKEKKDLQNDPKPFDIFAESSPPHKGVGDIQNSVQSESSEKNTFAASGSTPPMSLKTEKLHQSSSQLQNAIEIQKRIDKILQQDDIKLEAIEAAKEMLLRKTLKHQSTKDKQLLLTTFKSKDEKQNERKHSKNVKTSENSQFKIVEKDVKKPKENSTINKEKPCSSRTLMGEDNKARKVTNTKQETSTNRGEKDRSHKYVERSPSVSRESKGSYKDSHNSDSKHKSGNSIKIYNEKDEAYRKISTSKSQNPFKRSMSKDQLRSRTKSRDTLLTRITSDVQKRKDGSNTTMSVRRRNELLTESSSIKSHSFHTDSKSQKKLSSNENTVKDDPIPSRTKCKEKSDKNVQCGLQKQFVNSHKEEKSSGTLKLKKRDKAPKNKEIIRKTRPLSFSRSEFLSPKEEESADSMMFHDPLGSSSPTKSPSDKEGSPDTDDYIDNWENDEDEDIDTNSNIPGDNSTPMRLFPEVTEDDSFVTRFVNPSPPSENIKQPNECRKDSASMRDTTPPLSLLKNNKTKFKTIDGEKTEQTNLFGMQELYDQFIKSVEASGDEILEKTHISKTPEKCSLLKSKQACEDLLSTSSTSTSSTSSSSSTSSDNNSSSSSSSATSSDDSNDTERFEKFKECSTNKLKAESAVTSPVKLDSAANESSKTHSLSNEEPLTPVKKSILPTQIPSTPISSIKTSKTDVAKDFKKLKNLEANLSRIQLMRANYDSNDEISEELQKMEMLFLHEKKLILQKYAKTTSQKANIESDTFIQPLHAASPEKDVQVVAAPATPSELLKVESNKIFDANRETIKLTISPMKLPAKPAIFQTQVAEDVERKSSDDKEEVDFTEKFVKPAKEVAIVKPMMETKENLDSRSKDSPRERRPSVHISARDGPRIPTIHHRERNRRSSSRTRLSPHRRTVRGRSLSLSPPRRNLRHASPPRRGGHNSRFRLTVRRSRSRSRSRSPVRQYATRRGKESSPLRGRKTHKKFARTRSSGSRSPRSPQKSRSPRTPPNRRRSYSQDRYSPMPFKPPSPPMKRSHSPLNIPHSPARRSRSPRSPRRPRSPRSPRLIRSPRSPVSPSQDSRFDDHRRRRDNSFERHSSSISPQSQFFPPDSMSAGVTPAGSSYFYDMSPNRISLDARINIVLNGPGGHETQPTAYNDYSNYAQYGGAAYMSIPPQPLSDSSNASAGYYPNPYVPMLPPPTAQGHHHLHLPAHQHMQTHSSSMHHQAHSPHSSHYSNIPTISSGLSQGHTQSTQYYYNDFNIGQQNSNPVLKELPKVSAVAVQKGNVLEIVPTNVNATLPTSTYSSAASSPASVVLASADKDSSKKGATVSLVSWKEEVSNRHVKSAVMRLTRESDSSMRSILKKSDKQEKSDKMEKKKVYFEDGIFPSRDSDDEDRKIVEEKIRRKVLRLRKKRGVDLTPALKEMLGDMRSKLKSKVDTEFDKLPPPPPPTTLVPSNLDQPIYLRPPTPVPLVYFHFDAMVHSMYVSQLEKAIPPRLLNPKCGPQAGAPPQNITPLQQSPNMNSPSPLAAKKDLGTIAVLNRVCRSEVANMSSPKMIVDQKRDGNNPGHNERTLSKSQPHLPGVPSSSHMHNLPPVRHFSPPMGFVGMRINNFNRLPPSPLIRGSVPPFMPHSMPVMGLRHHQFNMPPPSLPLDNSYTMSQHPPTQKLPPSFINVHQRPPNQAFFMNSPSMQHPPPSQPVEKDNFTHKPPRVLSPQAMIAPFNVKKTVN